MQKRAKIQMRNGQTELLMRPAPSLLVKNHSFAFTIVDRWMMDVKGPSLSLSSSSWFVHGLLNESEIYPMYFEWLAETDIDINATLSDLCILD